MLPFIGAVPVNSQILAIRRYPDVPKPEGCGDQSRCKPICGLGRVKMLLFGSCVKGECRKFLMPAVCLESSAFLSLREAGFPTGIMFRIL
jgi:hypothetical protein